MSSDFATCRLDRDGPRRRSRVAPRYRKDGYEEAFDDRTLWFDAIWQDGTVTLVCPRLNNLAAMVSKGAFALDGIATPTKIRTFYRHSLVLLRSPHPPARVSFASEAFRLETPVHEAMPGRFRNRNVIVTMSKDNELAWIEDFARFHAETQGAEGIVFIDNGSALYGTRDIERVLDRTGLDPLVLCTGLPFGPRGRSPYGNTELFLQTCALNAVRLRYLRDARAVLCCDIDELVLGRTPVSIFDATWHSTFGLVRFGGEWRYAPHAPRNGIVRHDDHRFLAPGKSACPPKWCVRPSGPLGDLQWRPHILEGFAFNWAFRSRKFAFHHCRQITTGWKRETAAPEIARLVPTRPARQIADQTARKAVARPVPRRVHQSGPRQKVRDFGERSSRRFFGLRPALKTASLALALFIGLATEEAIDNDPVSQEIAYLMQGFQN
ncbi:hypothetical protein OCH239_13870 [Roseivivax halodurans JCM 10272]|uniref:Glycosyl transferase family 2 n=1 Tax=Roseivivax halodurans JCM 10272 TaxID=1449350 RepID=X7EID5_9RHOB|nr:hypothetical protein [Roseivivax halodurans]ETX15692.1 hypothetical protein OCH239_13870 [Roseivivax halodurans JCM 10272]